MTDVVRFQFERFVLTHLERRATPGTARRVRLYRCPDCGSPFSARQVEAAVSRERTSLLCPADETRVPLEDSYETLSPAQEGVAREMEASADAGPQHRGRVIRHPRQGGDDRLRRVPLPQHRRQADIRLTARQLRQRGILPWLDENELLPGRTWQEELERQISHIRAAAVFVGPSGIGPWQRTCERSSMSSRTRLPRHPGDPPRGGKTRPAGLPKGMTWVDLRARAVAGFDRLVWGITGRKPGLSELDQRLQ